MHLRKYNSIFLPFSILRWHKCWISFNGSRGHVSGTLSIPWLLVAWRRESHESAAIILTIHLNCIIRPPLSQFLCLLVYTLEWRYNECDGVSNHQRLGCLLKRMFRCRSKKTSKLRVTGLCEGIHRWPVNSPHKGPVTRKMFPLDDVIITCNVYTIYLLHFRTATYQIVCTNADEYLQAVFMSTFPVWQCILRLILVVFVNNLP